MSADKCSHELLALTYAYFRKYNYPYGALQSYNQVLDSINGIVEDHFKISFIKDNRADEKIKVDLWLSNVIFQEPVTIISRGRHLPPSPTIAMARGETYACTMIADVNIRIKLLESKGSKMDLLQREIFPLIGREAPTEKMDQEEIEIPIPKVFKCSIPIPVGSKYCTTRTLNDWSMYMLGEDIRDLGGWFIINGALKTLGNVYSYPFNGPTCTTDKYQDQQVRVDVMYREDVFYGNSYYMVPLIVMQPENIEVGSRKKRMERYDIIVIFRSFRGDIRKVKEGKDLINRIPIRALFFIYGCTTDAEIAKYILPGHHATQMNMSLLNRSFKHGKYHSKLDPHLSRSDAFLYIANEVMNENDKQILIHKAEADVKRFEQEESAPADLLENLIKQRKIKWAEELMKVFFMPNVNKDPTRVCIELGKLIRRLIRVFNKLEPETDRNSLENRRVHQVGEQFITEFRTIYRKVFLNPVSDGLTNSIDTQSYETFKATVADQAGRMVEAASVVLEQKIKQRFVKQMTSGQPTLLSEAYDPKSIMFLYSKMVEIAIRANAGERQASVAYTQRQVHPSHACFIGPAQTPESGADVGRFHAPAIYTKFSLASDTTIIMKYIKAFKSFDTGTPNDIENYYDIELNGSAIGVIPRGKSPTELVEYLLEKRRTDPLIDCMTGISINHVNQSVSIFTDSGRVCAPFILASALRDKNLKTKLQLLSSGAMSWDDAIKDGIVEWLDTSMISNAVVAQRLEDYYIRGDECTHILLPAGGSALIPAANAGADRHKGVRLMLLCNHDKQGIGWPFHNIMTRPLSELNYALHPQIPLVRSAIYDAIGLENHAAGENLVVAYLKLSDNQEDAIIMKGGSIARRMLWLLRITTTIFQTTTKGSHFGVRVYNSLYMPAAPEKRYSKIDPKYGIPTKIGVEIEKGDVIAAKYRTLYDEEIETIRGSYEVKDESELYTYGDKTTQRHESKAKLISYNAGISEKAPRKSIMLGALRAPGVGDKYSAQAQKGITAAIYPECDMPYTADGVRPDIIFNAAAVLRRETHGYDFMALLGKVCALMGFPLQSTPFFDYVDKESVSKALLKLGFSDRGDEVMYDGVTGLPYKEKIFVGVQFYVGQKHMVGDKAVSRCHGLRDPYTQQPVRGRDRKGGFKFSGMESHATRAAGAEESSRDSLFIRAAPSTIWVCDRCGNFAYPSRENKYLIKCDRCGLRPANKNHRMEAPYNTKLVRNVLGGAGIDMVTPTE